MNIALKYYLTIYFFITGIVLSSCNPNPRNNDLPLLETKIITNITNNRASSGGIILSNGEGSISGKGICWGTNSNPTVLISHTIDGSGSDSFESTLTNLAPETRYFVRSWASNSIGTAYGDEKSFITLSNNDYGQIIANHSIVDRFDDIPPIYIEEVKKMWLVVAGESHSRAYMTGLVSLKSLYPVFAVNYSTTGAPEPYTTNHLRASRKHWGDYDNPTGWLTWYGEEDWYTNPTAISRTKAGIKYCNETFGVTISAMGYGWCSDATGGGGTSGTDPVYGFRWHGHSLNGPDGDLPWGIDSEDSLVTGNSVNIGTYLAATQEYIDFCATNGYQTKIFFTTGPVDLDSEWDGDNGYEGHLKFESIREYVAKDPSRILFDYADILCYDDDGTLTTKTWNGHEYPAITSTNASPKATGHISSAGALRLAKAMWWMLARIAGWDGT